MAIRIARFIKSSVYAKILMRGFNKKIIPIRLHNGMHISFLFRSSFGDVLVSSGVKDGAVTGAMKHIMRRLPKYSKDPNLAKALALQDVAASIEIGMEKIATGQAVLGKKFLVETSIGRWELMFEMQTKGPYKGKIKLFHMLWDRRYN